MAKKEEKGSSFLRKILWEKFNLSRKTRMRKKKWETDSTSLAHVRHPWQLAPLVHEGQMQLIFLFYHYCSLGRGGVSHGYDPKLPPWKGGGGGSSQREGEPLFVAVLWRGQINPNMPGTRATQEGPFWKEGAP